MFSRYRFAASYQSNVNFLQIYAVAEKLAVQNRADTFFSSHGEFRPAVGEGEAQRRRRPLRRRWEINKLLFFFEIRYYQVYYLAYKKVNSDDQQWIEFWSLITKVILSLKH